MFPCTSATGYGVPSRVSRLSRRRKPPHAAVRRNDHQHRGDGPPARTAVPLQHRVRQRGIHRGKQQRDAVHPEEAGNLRDGQDDGLAVAEEHPGEAREQVGPTEFGGHPGRGRDEEAGRPEPRRDAVHHEREDRRVQRQVGGEQEHQQHGDRRGQVAELAHHRRGPVDGPDEVHEAGGEAEPEGAERCPARPRTLRAARQADQQGHERDPREGGMPEPREAESQQDAGEDG